MSSEPAATLGACALSLCLLAQLVGCDPASCVRHGDCPEGLICGTVGTCVVPPVEPPDGGDDAAMDLGVAVDLAATPSDVDLASGDASTNDGASAGILDPRTRWTPAQDFASPADAAVELDQGLAPGDLGYVPVGRLLSISIRVETTR